MTSIADLEVAFKNADSNKDGLLNITELSTSANLSVVQAESLMDYFAAGDEMTFSEYIVMSKVLKSDVSGVFKLWDKDKSGILDPAELTDLKVAMKITDEQWKDIIERVDLDKDGKIDAREFVLLCQTLNKKDNLPPKKQRKTATPASEATPAAETAAAPASVPFALIGVAVVAIGLFVAYQQGALDSLLKKNKK